VCLEYVRTGLFLLGLVAVIVLALRSKAVLSDLGKRLDNLTLEIFGAKFRAAFAKQEPVTNLPVEAGAEGDQQIVKQLMEAKTEEELEEAVRKHPRQAIGIHMALLEFYQFERILNVIFGTQVELLTELTVIGSTGIGLKRLEGYHQKCRQLSSGLYSGGMDEYIGFLKSSRLIEETPQSQHPLVVITDRGRKFLEYIARAYPSTYKLRPW